MNGHVEIESWPEPIRKTAERIISQDTIFIIARLSIFFDDDYEKVRAWLFTENMNFGGLCPMDLISRGKMDKVLRFIEIRDDS